MASKQDNYLRMHHPSIFKKMKKGGKVESYKKGGKVACYAQGGYNTDTVPAMLTPGEVVLNQDQQERLGNMMAGGGKASGGQERAAALFKHIGVPGFKEGQYLDKERYPGVRWQSKDWKDDSPSDMEWYIKNITAPVAMQQESPQKALEIGRPTVLEAVQLSEIKADKEKRERSRLVSKDLWEEGMEQRYAGGGLVDKKDALMAYYNGGKVDVTDVVKSAEKAKRFDVKAEETGKPIYTKKKKIHRRKAKKQAGEVLLEYYMGGRVKKKKKKQKRGD